MKIHNAWRIVLVSACLLARLCAAQEEKPVLFADKSPVELYRIVHRAKHKLDTATVLACTSRRAGATEESVYKQLMQERSTLPQTLDIVKEKVRGGAATLIFTGRRQDRETGELVTSRGTVTLVREDGTWRIRHERWTDIASEPRVETR
jgi:hypothetical protein